MFAANPFAAAYWAGGYAGMVLAVTLTAPFVEWATIDPTPRSTQSGQFTSGWAAQ